MLKKLVSFASASLVAFPMFAYSDLVSTSYKSVERIQIASRTEGDATFYFVNMAGWGAPGCEGAFYAYIRKSVPGSTEMLSMAATAKVAGQSVRFKGTCDANKEYFQVQYMFIK